jgi:hypothetical protein
MPAATNLLSAQQAFNSFTANGALYSDYVHRIAPYEIERWFALAGNHPVSALLQLKHQKELLIDAEVAGATILLKESGNDALLFDPGPYTSSIRLAEVNPCAILLTHAHKDHIAGLSWALSSWGDVRVIMSDITHELLLDILHSSNQYTLAEQVNSRFYRLNHGDEGDIGRFRVSAFQAGHCVGGLSYFVRPNRAEQGILIVGEFSRREVGGVRHQIPKLDVHTLFIESIHADETGLPTGLNDENNRDFIQKLDTAYREHKTIVIACASLAEMQEVYHICAMHQRDGGLPDYPLIAGNLRGSLKSVLGQLSHISPWDVPVAYTDSFEENSINILTCPFDESSQEGHFWNVYREHASNQNFAWFFPQRFSALKPDFADLYNAHTHASLSEILEMVLTQRPEHLCLYAGGTTGSISARLLSKCGLTIHDIAGGAGIFRL